MEIEELRIDQQGRALRPYPTPDVGLGVGVVSAQVCGDVDAASSVLGVRRILQLPELAGAARRQRGEAVPLHIGAPMVLSAAVTFVDPAGRHDLTGMPRRLLLAHCSCLRQHGVLRDPGHLTMGQPPRRTITRTCQHSPAPSCALHQLAGSFLQLLSPPGFAVHKHVRRRATPGVGATWLNVWGRGVGAARGSGRGGRGAAGAGGSGWGGGGGSGVLGLVFGVLGGGAGWPAVGAGGGSRGRSGGCEGALSPWTLSGKKGHNAIA